MLISHVENTSYAALQISTSVSFLTRRSLLGKYCTSTISCEQNF